MDNLSYGYLDLLPLLKITFGTSTKNRRRNVKKDVLGMCPKDVDLEVERRLNGPLEQQWLPTTSVGGTLLA